MKFNIVSQKYPHLADQLQIVINNTELNIDISNAVDAALSQVLEKLSLGYAIDLSDFEF